MPRSSKSQFSVSKFLILLCLLVLIIGALRMVYIVYGRAELAENRRDNALAELQETVSLADSLEAQVAQLQSESGQNKAVRERYGLVGPNQGYLILLHEHESEQQAAD